VSERPLPHVDLAGYLSGRLGGVAGAEVERHLAGCQSCSAAAGDLRETGALLALAAPAVELPPGLERRTLAAVARAAAERNGHVRDARGARAGELGRSARPDLKGAGEARRSAGAGLGGAAGARRTSNAGLGGAVSHRSRWRAAPRRRPRRARRRLALAGALAVVLAVGLVAGAQLAQDGPEGTLELEAKLRGADGAVATATVRETGIGRVIEFRTDELPILPKGEYYELWFVGPGDRPSDPNRISAGTFHPDERGRSRVRFAAAVDPARYPRLAVTAEPGDGDPRPNGPDLLRSGR